MFNMDNHKKMKYYHCNLNIHYDLPDEVWTKVPTIYKKMDGWLGFDKKEGIPHWFSFEDTRKHISASVEPSGLSFFAYMEQKEWTNWIARFKKLATEILGFKVGEPELGEI